MENKLVVSVDNNFDRKFKISQVLIDNWTYWYAAEIIAILQSKKNIGVQVDHVIQTLNLDSDCGFESLSNELISKKQELENTLLHQHSDDIKNTLEIYFSDIISNQINDLNQDLHLNFSNLLKQILDVQFDLASPKNLMEFLKEIVQKLSSKRIDFIKKKSFYFEREKSAWKSFDKLSEQEDSNKWKAIEVALSSKIESEKCDSISYIIVELIHIAQSYYGIVDRSYTMLENIKISLQDKNSLNISVSIPVFSMFDKVIEIEKQQKLLEIWLGGHKLNYWGSSPISWQAIEEKLLSNIEPDVLLFFSEFEAQFMSYL